MIFICFKQISNYIAFSYVDKHIVFQYNGILSFSENSIANSQIFDHITVCMNIKSYLKLSALMLGIYITRITSLAFTYGIRGGWVVFLETGNHKIINYFCTFLNRIRTSHVHWCTSLTMIILLVVQLHSFQASKVRIAIICFSIRLITNQTKWINSYNLTFSQTCWTQNFQMQFWSMTTFDELLKFCLGIWTL